MSEYTQQQLPPQQQQGAMNQPLIQNPNQRMDNIDRANKLNARTTMCNFICIIIAVVLAGLGMIFPLPGNSNFECSTNMECMNFTNIDSCFSGFCNMETRKCEARYTNETFECSTINDCELGEICNGCMCVDAPGCLTNEECINVDQVLECSVSFCNMTSQQCELELLEGSQCETNTNCEGNQICNNCTCVDPPGCASNSDCLDVDRVLTCSTSVCNTTSAQCELELLPNSQCETNSGCPGLMECKGCICVAPVDANATIACVLDSDCINVTSTNPCLQGFCNVATERCDTEYRDGFDCNGDDSQCGSGEVCDSCVCTDLCDGVTCDSDACSTRECDPKTGTCVVTDVVEGCCLDDESCGAIEWTNCMANFCGSNNTCFQNFTMGSECVVKDDCDIGEECQDCMCVSQSGGGCTVNEDCPALNYTTCLVNVCEDSTCVPVLDVESQCSDSSPCASGQFCNENCICESISAVSGFTLSSSGTFTTTGAVVITIPYRIYAQGSLRLFVHEASNSVTCSSSGTIFSGSSVAVQDRPSDIVYRFAVVGNNGLQQGLITLNAFGNIVWNTGFSGSFTSGVFCNVRENSFTYEIF